LDTDITVPANEIIASVCDIPVSIIGIPVSDSDIAVSVNEIIIFVSDITVPVIEISVFALGIPVSVIEIRLSMSQFPFLWKKRAKRAPRSQNRRERSADRKCETHETRGRFDR
jgi:hypothetical protein